MWLTKLESDLNKKEQVSFAYVKNRYGSIQKPKKTNLLHKSTYVNALPHREPSSVPSIVHHVAIMVTIPLLKNQEWWKGNKSQCEHSKEGQMNKSGRAEAHFVDPKSTDGFVYFE